MTQEQNIFYSKRNIIDTIWKSARLEGIEITYQETQAIYEGNNVAHLRIDEIQTINNLKHAWEYIFISLNDNVTTNFIKSVHALVGSNIVESPGKLRCYDVLMGGTDWKPELPSEEKFEQVINEYNQNSNVTDAILTLMCKLMKMQLFNDGNKRTSMLIANHELIKNGKGILSIGDSEKIEFGEKLIKYYEDDNNLEELKEFLSERCL